MPKGPKLNPLRLCENNCGEFFRPPPRNPDKRCCSRACSAEVIKRERQAHHPELNAPMQALLQRTWA